MKWDALEEEPCSLARTVAVIGDRWSLLILRECFLRIRRFDEFQASLGITRHLLADRLKKLVRFGVLRRVRQDVSLSPTYFSRALKRSFGGDAAFMCGPAARRTCR